MQSLYQKLTSEKKNVRFHWKTSELGTKNTWWVYVVMCDQSHGRVLVLCVHRQIVITMICVYVCCALQVSSSTLRGHVCERTWPERGGKTLQGAHSCTRPPNGCSLFRQSYRFAASNEPSDALLAKMVFQRLPAVSNVTDSNRSSAHGLWEVKEQAVFARDCSCMWSRHALLQPALCHCSTRPCAAATTRTRNVGVCLSVPLLPGDVSCR